MRQRGWHTDPVYSEQRTDYSVRFSSVSSNFKFKNCLGVCKEAWHCGSPGCSVGLYGIDATVMDLRWTHVCVAVLLSVCVRCKRSEMDTDRDQASRFRRMWLLSIKESKMGQKGKIGLV